MSACTDRQHPLGALQHFLQARRQDASAITGVVVALSGGPDSLTLLLAASQIAPTLGYRLRAVHVHHGLHPDADQWAQQTQRQAIAVGVPCEVLLVTVPVQASVEGAARQARYHALAAALMPDEALLLAHHQDDQAETVLLRLMRGAGLQGLSAMRSSSRWHAPSGQAMLRWRPWLDLPRAALERWRPRAAKCLLRRVPGIPDAALVPVTDPANVDARFDRTLLRHELMPLLARRWPEASRQLARSARQLAAQSDALDALADDVLGRAGYRPGETGPLTLPLISACDDPVLQAVLARWLACRGAPSLPVRYWPRVRRELLDARADAQPSLDWSGWSLRRYRQALHLLDASRQAAMPEAGVSWPDPAQPLQWAGREWRAEQLLEDLVENDPRLHQPWRLVPRQGGERWRPAGRSHRVSVKHWCQAQGVPPWVRDRLIYVWVGGDIVALVPLD